MSNKYKMLAIKSLQKRPSKRKGTLVESRMTYEDGHKERLAPLLAQQLREKKHSLGNHPAFPDDDESNFEEKLMSKRFADVLKAFKRHHGVESVDVEAFLANQRQLMLHIIKLEMKHEKELVDLAIGMIREEFDVMEDEVEIEADLTENLTLSKAEDKIKINPSTDVEFDNHQEFAQANKEVYKRRMINALIQGSAKKVNHMFHMIDDQLQDLEPLLPNLYAKLMTGADYMYMIHDDEQPRMIGGIVNVEFPKKDGDIPKISVQAVTLPVLIHEIVKGIMEILSYHGLPKDSKIAKFVIDKADFMAAESWDMRLGPAIWEKFCECIPSEDFHLKHHVYVELVSLPVDEFNDTLREILMCSRTGKAKMAELVEKVKDELKDDEFDNVMSKLSDDDYFGPEDLDNLNDEDWFM